MFDKKWRCEYCGTITLQDDLLEAPSPFDPQDTLWGCPNCKSAEGFDEICDEPGCKNETCCGVPTEKGYRRVCHEHYAAVKEKGA